MDPARIRAVGGLAADARLDGDVLSLEEMLGLDIFEGCAEALLAKNEGAVARRVYEPGEVICVEGEYGSTAFYLLEGDADVFIATPIAHLKGTAKSGGWLGSIGTFLQSLVRRAPEEEENLSRTIPIDGPVDLAVDRPEATLARGDLFGEMTCLSFYPRSATVRARTRVVALEMLRSILDILKRGSKTFKETIDTNYKERALAAHMRNLQLFSGLTDEFLAGLKERVTLTEVAPGKVICKQGDDADRLYLIRIGFVKVTRESPGGEIVLQYLHRGDYFGEMGLLGSGKRTATCTALDHVELVEIPKADFDVMMERFPAIRKGMEETARVHEEQNRRVLEKLRTTSLDDFLEQGLMQAHSLLLIDLDRCTRCDECTRACAATHDGVTRLIRDGLRYDRYLVPTSCRSCHDPLCMVGCPVGSIRRRETMEIVIEDWCIGCEICAKNCPYGNINMHVVEYEAQGAALEKAKAKEAARREGGGAGDEPRTEEEKRKAHLEKLRETARKAKPQKAITCDLCADLKEPSCVYACPHEAAQRVDPLVFFGGRA